MSKMDLKQKCCSELRIPWHYVDVQDDSKLLCLVHETWLQSLLSTRSLPIEFRKHDTMSDIECELLLKQQQRHIEHPWRILELKTLKKFNGRTRRLRKCQNSKVKRAQDHLGFSQLLHYVSETNYRNLWKDAYRRYPNTSYSKNADQPEKLSGHSDAIHETLIRLYGCPVVNVDSKEVMVEAIGLEDNIVDDEQKCHHNILSSFCVLESSSNFYIVQSHVEHSVADCVTFSPSILGNSSTKPLFVIYQVLHCVRDLHDRGLFLGDVGLRDLRVDSNNWIYVQPKIFQNFTDESNENSSSFRKAGVSCKNVSLLPVTLGCLKDVVMSNDDVDECHLNELTYMWVHGVIGNYEYLMALNKLAGRRAGNPNHHPVLPWIMDFTVQNGGWRDLSRSKFRLNKGDRQLDLTYESLPSIASGVSAIVGPETLQVPHHVSDVLSEITYYVYTARRTPRSVLCVYVRSNWVPAEYPSSMQRMFDWTPDECIPEFFSDPDIFRSIHNDLPDLEIPWWASSPEDFIRKHRAALEGHHVSERLHHWIDLTFGYKLSGPAAVKAKNVCLHLVDQHTRLSCGGVVQLFTQPHPYRIGFSLYMGIRPPRLHHVFAVSHSADLNARVDRLHDNEIGFLTNSTSCSNSSREQSGEYEIGSKTIEKRKTSKSKVISANVDASGKLELDSLSIIFPKDYNPLMMLNHLEALYNFTVKTTYRLPENTSQNVVDMIHGVHELKARDMVVIGCLVVEIFLAPKLRALRSSATLEERYRHIRSLLRVNFYELPRCVRQAVHLLLQLNSSEDGIPKTMPAVTDCGLPPPSARQLLQPLIHVFPFPNYFSDLYLFLCKVQDYRNKLHDEKLLEMNTRERLASIERLAEQEVKMTASLLPDLLARINEEGLELLIPYVRQMFNDMHTAVPAAWHLFNMFGQALGPQRTAKTLIEPLIRLFDTEYPTAKYLKLFHRSYLLQLSIRLGLQTFLAYFTTRLIEAVGGFKDFGGSSVDGHDMSGDVRKGSHLRSPELEGLTLDSAQDTEGDCTLSPFDENLSQTEIASPWSHSEADNTITTSAVADQDTEPEIFTFEAAEDDFCTDVSDRVEGDMIDQYEQKSGENSSDSTSVDAISIGDVNVESGHSPLADEDDVPNKAKPNPSSFSEGFLVTIPKNKRISKSDSFSSSVPNILTSYLDSNVPDELSKEDDVAQVLSTTTCEEKSSKADTDYNISDVATESIIWLSHRIGPVLTAKYLSRNLLRMISLCYLGDDQLETVIQPKPCTPNASDLAITISPRQVIGDRNSSKVFECLTNIASLYGEQFVMLQYFPHVVDIVAQAKKRVTPSGEAGIIGSMALVCHIIPYLSNKTLMDHLQDTIIKEILYPTVRLISSLRLSFPGGGHARQMIAFKLLDALHLIGLRIGFEQTRKYLTPTLQRFFSAFSRVYGRSLTTSEVQVKESSVGVNALGCLELTSSHILNESWKASCDSMSPPVNDNEHLNVQQIAKEELLQAFTAELAYVAYIPFCKLAGSIHMERSLPNDELIHQLCLQHDQVLGVSNFALDSSKNVFDNKDLAVFSESINTGVCSHTKAAGNEGPTVIGNRIVVHVDDEEDELVPAGVTPMLTSPAGDNSVKIAEYPKCDVTKLISRQMENDHRHLKGNWFAYWEHEIGRSEKDHRFNFKQIKLQTFKGHVSNVRAIHVFDNENSFITASKDKTVKLWSLRSYGNGLDQVTCRFTYPNHRKSVFSVTFLESLRLVASCDSTVHVWDPFMGSCIKQFDPTKNSPVTVLAAMPAPSRVILAATTEATVRFMDVRSLHYMHDFKVSLGSAGLIRCLAVSPNGLWIAVGHSTGIISILDARTGLMSSTWKGHEGEVLQVKAFNNNTFVSSSLDQCVSVWNADDGKLKCHLRGPTEPVHCLGFYKNEMISGTTASRIGVHTSVDSQASFSSTRLRSDTFKGVLTSLTVLPMNRLLLLGADNGTVRLLC